MSSSGEDASSFIPPGMFGAASPMPGLPVAGKDNVVGDPYEYGKFQNFLPDIKASGPNDSATGLRPEMFQYQKPSGVTAPRDQLAQVIAAPAAPAPAASSGTDWAPLFAQMSPQDIMTWQNTMNSAGRGDEASSALSSWRGG